MILKAEIEYLEFVKKTNKRNQAKFHTKYKINGKFKKKWLC